MALELYNTLTRTKTLFKPIDAGNVRMYACGPTVYDFAHIGNARPAIVFDVLFRLLRHLYPGEGTAIDGSRVTYVRNITDVDDKINARALRDFPERDFPNLPLNDAIRHVTEKTTAQYHADVAALGCLPPTVEPRATDNIAQMIDIIAALLKGGHAYEAAGEVLFDTRSMPDYGALSRRNLEEQQAGARVEVEAHKKNAADFVLWKQSSPEEPGWDSPWGRGRPGWHIECSAMSKRYLGDVFDIHGGGLDLIFPHHENEIAQSRCAFEMPVMANVWMHNGFLQVEGEKMSKSLGNFVTINELLETNKFGGHKWPGEVVRLAMLKTHYRQPIDWTRNLLREAEGNYRDLAIVRRRFVATEPSAEFLDALKDDINTKEAIDVLMALLSSANRGNAKDGGELAASLRLLGLLAENATIEFPGYAADEFGDVDESHDGQRLVAQALANLVPDNATVREIARVYAGRNNPLPERVRGMIADLLQYVPDDALATTYLQDPDKLLFTNGRIAARLEARKRKDFAESDRIRDELAQMGVTLKDSKNKETGEIETTWEVAR